MKTEESKHKFIDKVSTREKFMRNKIKLKGTKPEIYILGEGLALNKGVERNVDESFKTSQ